MFAKNILNRFANGGDGCIADETVTYSNQIAETTRETGVVEGTLVVLDWGLRIELGMVRCVYDYVRMVLLYFEKDFAVRRREV